MGTNQDKTAQLAKPLSQFMLKEIQPMYLKKINYKAHSPFSFHKMYFKFYSSLKL